MTVAGPTIAEVRALRETLGDSIWTTPLTRCGGIELELDNGTSVWGKLEFLQRTGTFKARGALANLAALTHEQRQRGVTAVSARPSGRSGSGLSGRGRRPVTPVPGELVQFHRHEDGQAQADEQ